MGLWGSNTNAASRPKFLPRDSNAAGSMGARENAIAVAGGWGLAPGLGASGNDNKAAQPEVLVCIRNLAAVAGSATVKSIDWTDGAVADTGTFDITVTFDEAIDVTSAAWSANQTVTNKAYILLSRIGTTDMVEDSTMACQYYSGTGTNQIVFRGLAQTGDDAVLAFNGGGQGDDTSLISGITFNGSADFAEEDGVSVNAMRQEGGSASAPADRIVLDSAAAITAKTNGAITTASTTLTLDNNSGTIAVGQTIYSLVGATSLTDEQSSTAVSQDGTLTVTAVASQNSITVSKAVTVADNVDLNFAADGHDSILTESIDFQVQGDSGTTDIMDIARAGEELGGDILLEQGAQTTGRDTLVMDASDGSSTDENDNIDLEDQTSGVATSTVNGSASGTATKVLTGVTVTAA